MPTWQGRIPHAMPCPTGTTTRHTRHRPKASRPRTTGYVSVSQDRRTCASQPALPAPKRAKAPCVASGRAEDLDHRQAVLRELPGRPMVVKSTSSPTIRSRIHPSSSFEQSAHVCAGAVLSSFDPEGSPSVNCTPAVESLPRRPLPAAYRWPITDPIQCSGLAGWAPDSGRSRGRAPDSCRGWAPDSPENRTAEDAAPAGPEHGFSSRGGA